MKNQSFSPESTLSDDIIFVEDETKDTTKSKGIKIKIQTL